MNPNFAASLCAVASLAVLLLSFAPRAMAQAVVARSAPAVEAQSFASPMVLEYSLEEALKAPREIDERIFANFICKGVSIPRLKLRIARVADKEGSTFMITAYVNNQSDKDRDVVLRLTVISGESSLGSADIKRFQVEEDETVEKGVVFPVALPAEIGSPYPILRISVELMKN